MAWNLQLLVLYARSRSPFHITTGGVASSSFNSLDSIRRVCLEIGPSNRCTLANKPSSLPKPFAAY
ncbi:hypothetical protein DL89DRAFT_112533 [Linderina pennispora]|uniref:Uncharacterized protein n=1 Tax=Linderina pennispora TaxID=61395 RepID=A0A1Y1WG99_9FUNG|nr:uncharacterized protein DL89DRAFT_112533 [Linderina pennispora]ORX72368.1 hypothetical protein DL89DRAFT_112533 [Linderina pennispora]